MVLEVCRELEGGKTESARLWAQTTWPFEPQQQTKRSISPSQLMELRYHTVSDAAEALGGIPVIRDTFIGFQRYLYEG